MKMFRQTRWRNQWQVRPLCAPTLKSWLIDNGSLTARLKSRYHDFAVQPVRLQYTTAFNDEFRLIGLKANQQALIRDVLLIGNKQPVVFAHSVLPRASLRGHWRGLGKLGNKPLGAALFANPKVKRTPLQFKKLSSQHPLLRRVNQRLSATFRHLWARRSIFRLGCASILVTEVFLPEIGT